MNPLVKYSGIISIVFFWAVFFVGIVNVGFGNLASFSELGILEGTSVPFNLSLALGALIAIIFFVHYLGERHELNKYYWLSYTAVFITQILLSFITVDPAYPLYYTAHHGITLIFFLAIGGVLYSFAVSLKNRVPGSIKKEVVIFVLVISFALSAATSVLSDTILLAELIFVLYTHYWIVRTTFLRKSY